jgi:tetratricopeptide (TPR) repeat protein
MNAVATAHRPEKVMESDSAAEAGEAWRCRNIAEARERLAAAMAHSPDDGELPLALGHVEMSLGNFEAARAAYASAARLLPNAAAAHSSLALTCQKLGRSTEAARAALRAIALEPDDAAALKVLARIHLDAGQHEAAQAVCRLILRRDDHDAEARQMMGEALAQEAKLAENLFDSKTPLTAPPPRRPPKPA